MPLVSYFLCFSQNPHYTRFFRYDDGFHTVFQEVDLLFYALNVKKSHNSKSKGIPYF